MIGSWLHAFEQAWQTKDFGGIRKLFRDDVEYWETPFRKLETIDAVMNEWRIVRQQSNIEIATKCIAKNDDLHVIEWDLSYDLEGLQKWRGIYLIRLDMTGQCYYFYQVGEKEG